MVSNLKFILINFQATSVTPRRTTVKGFQNTKASIYPDRTSIYINIKIGLTPKYHKHFFHRVGSDGVAEPLDWNFAAALDEAESESHVV